MARSRVIVENRWRLYRDQLDVKVERALGEAAIVTAGAAKAKAARSRYNLGPITEKIGVDPVRRGFRGLEVTIADRDFRAHFFERGTYQKLGRRASKRSREGEPGNRGVRAIHFMGAGKTAGRKALLELLRRELS